ncbi:MAG TPA: AAA family ATPase [Pirellulaceae bacterium]|nr:AAA family ATPase [Pirellulaceae bacterium]
MHPPPDDCRLALARRLNAEVLASLKAAFVGKDEIIDLLGVCLAGGENLFLLGPPGTAKSALVQQLARRIDGRVFDYLLTRFTEPNELFGPFDIRKLRDGELVTNTEGMLPEAALVFLDELLNANSAILNSLLMVLNERVFRRGRETRRLPLLMVVGASNRLPEDDALAALFDRFLLRVRCDNVPADSLGDVLAAGWKLDQGLAEAVPTLAVDDIRQVQSLVAEVDLAPVRTTYIDLVHKLRQAGIPVSDRRAVKLQRLVAASAALCGRAAANTTDLWILRYIWDVDEQREVIAAIVNQAVEASPAVELEGSHPRARQSDGPDPEELAKDLKRIGERLAEAALAEAERAVLRDQLGLLSGRCQWVVNAQQREFLDQRVAELWQQLGVQP